MLRRPARNRVSQAIALTAGLLTAGAFSGCHKPNVASDLRIEPQANDWVEVSKPTVIYDKDAMVVAGHVKRKPGVTGEIAGRVDVDVIGPDGKPVAWIPALLTPSSLPDANGQSDYTVRYGYIPLAGSTVQVRFVDAETAKLEDTDNVEYSNGKGGAGGYPATAHPAATNAGREKAPSGKHMW
jgi:hypothetical protein